MKPKNTTDGQLFRLNRLYSMLRKVNEAIVRIHDEGKLYEQVCRIAVEEGLFRMAWVGITDPETREVKTAAQWGDTGGYLDTIRVVADNGREGTGPTGRAIYELRSVICSDIANDPLMHPWRDKALGHGFRSSAAFPLRSSSIVIGALSVYSGTPHFFVDEEIYLLSALAGDISYAIDSITNERKRIESEGQLIAANKLLRALSEHLQTAREEERIKIAREIHDELGQILTAASIELARIGDGYGDHKALLEKIASASELIDIAIDDVQRICSELRPQVLDHLGLIAAIEWQADEFTKRSGVRCVLKMPQDNPSLQSEVSTALFRVLQETLTNTTRHAGASEVSVCLKIGDAILLEVRDNGKGITPENISNSTSFGIIGIQERIHALGGTVSITGIQDKGTTIVVKVPLKPWGRNHV
ncbi:MAG: GAF domain-containing sensor histidine kinase [Thermodesulfovibrionales bacterium]